MGELKVLGKLPDNTTQLISVEIEYRIWVREEGTNMHTWYLLSGRQVDYPTVSAAEERVREVEQERVAWFRNHNEIHKDDDWRLDALPAREYCIVQITHRRLPICVLSVDKIMKQDI